MLVSGEERRGRREKVEKEKKERDRERVCVREKTYI